MPSNYRTTSVAIQLYPTTLSLLLYFTPSVYIFLLQRCQRLWRAASGVLDDDLRIEEDLEEVLAISRAQK